MIPIRVAIADLKKAIAQIKGSHTRLELCATTPTRKRLVVELAAMVRVLEEDLRGLKYRAEQERRQQVAS